MIKSENAKEKVQSKSIGFQHLWYLIYNVMFCWHLTVIWGCKHAKLPCAAVKYIWLLKPLLSLRKRKLSKLNKVIKLSRQSSTHAIQGLKIGVQGPSGCARTCTQIHIHIQCFICLQWIKSNLHRTQILHRFYVGTFKDTKSIVSTAQPALITADTAGHSVLFGRAWNLTGLKHTHTHIQAHINELRHIHNTPTLTVTHSHCLIYFCVSS